MINPNAAFEDELYSKYLRDPNSVSPAWRDYFNKKYPGRAELTEQTQPPPKKQTTRQSEETIRLSENETFEPLSSVQSRLAENMEESIEVPTATSIREMPVKALDENRRIINKYLIRMKRNKVSFTHVLAWAIVRALVKYPHMNDAFARKEGQAGKIRRRAVNIGLAVDITKKDGTRLLLVPNVKNAETFNFSQFIEKFDELIYKTRNNKIDLNDLDNTTITLTNPGMIGTTASNPRLMKGQGLIIATGSIDYPTEFKAVRPDFLTQMALSKVVTITSTYDHRIIQGAESAEFLQYINELLIGKDYFYDQIFAALRIPFEPVRWELDRPVGSFRPNDPQEAVEKNAHVMLMINAYRVRGHLLASVNPLGFESYYYPELDPAYYGFTIWDLDRIFHADDSWRSNNLPLREIIELMRDTYCGAKGFEFMHIQDPEKKDWIKKRLETENGKEELSKSEKIKIYNKLVEAETFENFLHTKFVGHKRFSLEGSESLIVMIDEVLSTAADVKLNSAVIGMAHRGRLNVLVNNIGKSPAQIFREFDDDIDTTSYLGSGDVKYHLGDRGHYNSEKGNTIKIILSPNPSHLELVNPVIEGMARAIDNEIGDRSHSKSLPILVHGDSAFAGQGIVAETLNLSKLQGYRTGGTIHLIINNQIGFTTTSESYRSTVYATDIAKMIQCPIIHVNGHKPEAVRKAARFAFEYRQKFGSDVIIDMLCYRKYGHNEADEPSYTQPLLYKKIKSMDTVRKDYADQLIKDGVFSESEAEHTIDEVKRKLEDHFENRKHKVTRNSRPEQPDKFHDMFKPVDTAVDEDTLRHINERIHAIPESLHPHPKVDAMLSKRAESFDSDDKPFDWAYAEALAFGSLLYEGREIRFSGEDSRRGTFSQRHSVIVDIETEQEYIPLNHLRDGQAELRIYDSPLSEMAVLGFEYGYSVIQDKGLTLWEAQFGDFTNMAQAIVDQFIVCAEAKWGQTSNLTLLLPHSYDGQGPEHSSARPERFLQQCAEYNIIVGNLSTPAQYFHILRRQVHNGFRIPLVLMTPKSMLRHPQAVSSIDDLSKGRFREIIDDEIEKSGIRRIIFCAGKYYYELLNQREKSGADDTAIVRIEQLYPVHEEKLSEIIESYENREQIIWAQEEPQNMGAWTHISPYLYKAAEDTPVRYSGREPSASTATGSYKKHVRRQKEILEDAYK
ncbi:MAG: multifunctional oxoglutarate decarboxylase/oxoglutarate dehydrogenase thiamine pyrophosphate-binding subunit/dihydrolipoyllysine-residue succinyltransferase subunit [Candidatus Kapaibacterium sp.]